MESKNISQFLPEVMNSVTQSMRSMSQRVSGEISIYSGELASKQQVLSEAKKLIAAFPDIGNDYIILLVDRLTDNRFTAQRVKDAINHVIDTNPYKRPSIADIISFDKKVKLFTYSEIEAKGRQGEKDVFENYERVKIEGKVRFIER